jgi:hypothetical protein
MLCLECDSHEGQTLTSNSIAPQFQNGIKMSIIGHRVFENGQN